MNGQPVDPFAPRRWQLARGRELELGPIGRLMGVLNVTPDSFSDAGQHFDQATAIARGMDMIGQGADIIDVGGESSRPGAEEIDGDEERARILPVIEALVQAGALVSIDTWRSETAEAALKAGAHIVNDIWGCQRDPALAEVAAKYRAGLVIMHTSRDRVVLDDVVEDQLTYFRKSLSVTDASGVGLDQVVLDPGIGFGKDGAGNLAVLAHLDDLHVMTLPLMLGTSRKRFLGTITGREPMERAVATAATTALGRHAGVAIVRVHDVVENRDAMRVADAWRTGIAHDL